MDKKVVSITASIGQFNRITRNYLGSSNDGIDVVIDNVNSTIEAVLIPHQYPTKHEFPNKGNPAICYVDISENKTYTWNEMQLKYHCIGSDYNQIKIINGGTANNE